MATTIAELLVTLGFDPSEFISGLDSATSVLNSLGGKFTAAGIALTAAVTAPLVGIATESLKASGDFESAMNKVSALGEITGSSLDKLRAQAMQLGADTMFSAQQAADGMGNLAAAGFRTEQIMQAMPSVLDLAAAGNIKVSAAAKDTAEALGQWGLKASDAQRLTDVMAKAAASGSLELSDLASSFKFVGPVSVAAGGSLVEVTAALTLLSNAGIKGTTAGRNLSAGMLRLLDPPKAAAKALNELGVSAVDSSGKLLPLNQIIDQFVSKGASIQQLAEIVGKDSVKSWAALVNQGGDSLRKMTAEIDNSNGAVRQMAATMQQGFNGALERTRGSVETLAITLGKALTPAAVSVLALIEQLANAAIPLVQAFAQMPVPVQDIAIGIAALAAAAGPVLLALGGLAFSISAIIGLVTPLSAAFGTSVAATAELGAGLTTLTGLASLAHAGIVALAAAAAIAVAGWIGWDILKQINTDLGQFVPLLSSLEGVIGGVGGPIGVVQFGISQLAQAIGTFVAAHGGKDFLAFFERLALAPTQIDFSNISIQSLNLKGAVEQTAGPLGTFLGLLERLKGFKSDVKFTATGQSDDMDAAVKATLEGANNKTQASMAIPTQSLQALAAAAQKTKLAVDGIFAGTAADAMKLHTDQTNAAGAAHRGAASSVKTHSDALTAHNEVVKETVPFITQLTDAINRIIASDDTKRVNDYAKAWVGVLDAYKKIREFQPLAGAPDIAANQTGVLGIPPIDTTIPLPPGVTQEDIDMDIPVSSRFPTTTTTPTTQKTGGKTAISQINQQVSTIITDAGRSITDVLFGGGASIPALQKAADQAKKDYDAVVASAKEAASQAPSVVDAQNKVNAAQSQLDNLNVNATSSTRSRYEALLKSAKDQYDQTLKNAQAASASSDVVKAAYDKMTAAQARAADPSIWDRFKNITLNVFEQIGKAIVRAFIETGLKAVSNFVVGAIDKLAGGLGQKVGGILGGIFGSGGSASGGVANAPGVIKNAVGGTGGAGSAAGGIGSAIGGVAGAVNLVSGIVGAAADVGNLIEGIRQEGTMNQIERNTAAASIHLQHLLEQADNYWPKLQDIWEFDNGPMLTTLREIRDAVKNFVTVNLNLGTGTPDAQRILDSVVNRTNSFDQTANDHVTDMAFQLVQFKTSSEHWSQIIRDAIVNEGQLIVGQLDTIAKRQPSTLERILGLGGGGLAAGGSAIGGILGGIGGIFSGLFGGGSDKSQSLTEENTRFTQIRTANMEQAALQYWPKLADINDRLFDQIGYWFHLLATMDDIHGFLDPEKQAARAAANATAGAPGLGNPINGAPVYFVVPDASSLDRLMQLFAAYMTGQPA